MTSTMATNTLDAVRQRIAAEEPELRRRGVCHLAVFGSGARGDDRPDRDVDVALEIEADRSFSLVRMEETRLFLEGALRRRVDLGEVDSFRAQVRAAFERDRVPIFQCHAATRNGSRTLSRSRPSPISVPIQPAWTSQRSSPSR
jgi:predicted nucleotidyltransferase